MNQSFLNLRFEQIEKRFGEIDILIGLAEKNQDEERKYQALCRSAHVLLISHFEGLYKDICKDVIDDINANTNFYQVRRPILNTFCNYFIQNTESEKSTSTLKFKLQEFFKEYSSNLKVDPFLFVDNKNPAPQILETILERFGIKNFFWSIEKSDLDIVFEDTKSQTLKLRNKLLAYLKKNTFYYPYIVDTSIYNPIKKENQPKTKTFWEDFLNNFLKERHNIVHGDVLEYAYNHENISDAKIKIEILTYAYTIHLCSVSTPIIFLPEPSINS